jgi:hypothetical protein
LLLSLLLLLLHHLPSSISCKTLLSLLQHLKFLGAPCQQLIQLASRHNIVMNSVIFSGGC